MPKYVRVEVVTRYIAKWSSGDIMSDAHMGKANASGCSTDMVVAESIEELMDRLYARCGRAIDILKSDVGCRGFAYRSEYLVYKGKMYQAAGSQEPLFSDKTDNKCVAWDLLLEAIKKDRSVE